MLRRFLAMAEVISKRLKLSPVTIGTHNGHFHADEALAVYMLRLLPTYKDSSLVRTRDPELLAECHTVVDVGGEYSPDSNRYDHHQRTFNTTFPDKSTKLSSAGLVYMHFGRAIIAQRTGLQENDAEVELLYQKLYTDFIEAVDANDNGIELYDPKALGAETQKRYKDHGVTLASLVSDLNTQLDDPLLPPTIPATSTEILNEQAAEDARFLQASSLMGTSFVRKLALAFGKWLPARNEVLTAYNSRTEVDSSGQIMILPKSGIPWKEHLYNIEAAHAGTPEILFVIYPEKEDDPASKWRVQAVSINMESFQNRRSLKEEWRGLRDSELSEKSGIPDCVFVHAAGFIGGNASKEGALRMAQESMLS